MRSELNSGLSTLKSTFTSTCSARVALLCKMLLPWQHNGVLRAAIHTRLQVETITCTDCALNGLVARSRSEACDPCLRALARWMNLIQQVRSTRRYAVNVKLNSGSYRTYNGGGAINKPPRVYQQMFRSYNHNSQIYQNFGNHQLIWASCLQMLHESLWTTVRSFSCRSLRGWRDT